MEREEKLELYWVRCSSEENNVGDDMEGGIWDVYALDVPWLRVPETADEVAIPFRFFDGSAIWEIYSKFQSVEMKEDEKRWILGFMGRDLVENWGRNQVLKIQGFWVRDLQKSRSRGFWNFEFIDTDAL